MTTSMVPVTADAVLAKQPAADISDCCVVFEVPRFGSTRRSFASVCGGSVVVLNYDPMLINTCLVLRTHPVAQGVAVLADSPWRPFDGTVASLDVPVSAPLWGDDVIVRGGQSHRRPTAAQALVDRVRAFQRLPADWAGDDTIVIDDAAVSAAERIIDAIAAAGLPLPQASPSSEGEVGLTWYRGRDMLDLTVDPDMHIVWVTRIAGKVEPGDVVAVDSWAFPDQIVEAVRGFYGAVPQPVPRRA